MSFSIPGRAPSKKMTLPRASPTVGANCRGVVTASVLFGEPDCEAMSSERGNERVMSETRDTSLPRFGPSIEGKTYSCFLTIDDSRSRLHERVYLSISQGLDLSTMTYFLQPGDSPYIVAKSSGLQGFPGYTGSRSPDINRPNSRAGLW